MVEDVEAKVAKTKEKPLKSSVAQKLCWADWCEESTKKDSDCDDNTITEVFMTSSSKSGPNKWLADTGSTVHCTNDESYIPHKEKGIISSRHCQDQCRQAKDKM